MYFSIFLTNKNFLREFNFIKQENPLTTEQEKWEKFNCNEVTYAQQGWYENIGNTLKKTSATGKGPLWAKVATSIAYSKAESGEPMCGVKINL